MTTTYIQSHQDQPCASPYGMTPEEILDACGPSDASMNLPHRGPHTEASTVRKRIEYDGVHRVPAERQFLDREQRLAAGARCLRAAAARRTVR
jgi:hypothetical protein